MAARQKARSLKFCCGWSKAAVSIPIRVPLPVVKAVKALKAGKSVTLKIKSPKLSGDQASTFIFATDTNTNILAFAEVPGP